MEDAFALLSPAALRLYQDGIVRFADENGVCKANQRELIRATGMAFKTLIPARDELLSHGLIVRHKFKYQGKRDWYQLVDIDEAQRNRRTAERTRKRQAQAASEDALLPLF